MSVCVYIDSTLIEDSVSSVNICDVCVYVSICVICFSWVKDMNTKSKAMKHCETCRSGMYQLLELSQWVLVNFYPTFLNPYFRSGVEKVSAEAKASASSTEGYTDFMSLIETTPQATSHSEGPEYTVPEDLAVRLACLLSLGGRWCKCIASSQWTWELVRILFNAISEAKSGFNTRVPQWDVSLPLSFGRNKIK